MADGMNEDGARTAKMEARESVPPVGIDMTSSRTTMCKHDEVPGLSLYYCHSESRDDRSCHREMTNFTTLRWRTFANSCDTEMASSCE
jgi:hypothetical protein